MCPNFCQIRLQVITLPWDWEIVQPVRSSFFYIAFLSSLYAYDCLIRSTTVIISSGDGVDDAPPQSLKYITGDSISCCCRHLKPNCLHLPDRKLRWPRPRVCEAAPTASLHLPVVDHTYSSRVICFTRILWHIINRIIPVLYLYKCPELKSLGG